jgi:hypothetical protein
LEILTESNFARNIIIVLANLPDFLRKPILKKRMTEYFSLPEQEKEEIINNALEAGPTIPFPNFSKLFKTWLQVLATFSEKQRKELFLQYINAVINFPEKLINFHLDGILEIFMSLNDDEKLILSKSLREIIAEFDGGKKKTLLALIPNNAKIQIGV